MYKIEKHDEYLLVRFEADFDYNGVQAIFHHLTSLKEYPDTNDIWLIGDYHADIRLGELECMMRDFHCRCHREGERTKTAIVVKPGLTEAIIELWVNATRKMVHFDIRIFQSISEARMWMGIAQSQVA